MYKFILVTIVTLSSLTFPMSVAQAKDGDIKLPVKLTCKYMNRGSETDVLYTRLGKIVSSSQIPATGQPVSVWDSIGAQKDEPKEDEVAAGWSGDYYEAGIDREEYHYSLWTCDTEDRWYVFPTKELVLPAHSKIAEKPVSGKVTIEVRDEGKTYDLDCLATY